MSWSGHFTLASRCLDGQKSKGKKSKGKKSKDQNSRGQKFKVQMARSLKDRSAKARSLYGQKSGWADVGRPELWMARS